MRPRTRRYQQSDADPASSGSGQRAPGKSRRQTPSQRRYGGRQLPTDAQRDLGAATGGDLSRVRVHDDPAAHADAERLGARAFATGDDIVFGAGEYEPGTPDGDALLAHEVAHTVQQAGSAGQPATKLRGAAPATDAESQADALGTWYAGDRAEAPPELTATAASLQRKGKDDQPAPPEEAGSSFDLGEDVTLDFGEAPLDPIEVSWDPEAFVLGGDAAKAELDLDIGMRFEPDNEDRKGLDPGEIYVASRFWASARGGAEATTRADKSWEAGEHQDDLELGGKIAASVEASGRASYTSRRKHSRESYERVRRALNEIRPAVEAAFELYRDGVRLAAEAEKHIARARMGAESLEDAFDQAIAIVETGEGMGEWAAELALLGETFGEILIAAYEVGGGAAQVVGTLMGNPLLARELETGEQYEIRLAAEGAANLEGEAAGGVSAANAQVSGSAQEEAQWERVFRVEGIEQDGDKGVAIFVHFTRSDAGGFDVEGGAGAEVGFGKGKLKGKASGEMSLGREEYSKSKTGHKLEVRLPRSHPRFDRLYSKVFAAVTPTEILALTYDEELQFDKERNSGITTLTLDNQWLGEGLTQLGLSGQLSVGDEGLTADGSVGGATSGHSTSHVTIDYENNELSEVDVDSHGESKVVYEGKFEVQGELGKALQDLGVDPEFALDPGSFWKSTVDFEYDGRVASLTGNSGTVDTALKRINVALGKRQLEKIALRASQTDEWDAIGAMSYTVDAEAQRQWRTLGENLVRANSAKREVQLAGKSLGIQKNKAELGVLMVGPDNKKHSPVVDGQPYVPPEAARDWRIFLIADLIGGFVDQGSTQFGADDVATALGRARGMGYTNSGDWQEYQPDYEEVGIEGNRFDITFSDGKKVTDADLFTVVEDGGYDIRRDLETATEQASRSIAEQAVRHAATGAALEIEPDEGVMRPAEQYLGELDHLLSQTQAQAELTSKLAFAGGSSMVRFLTDMNTMVSNALSAYQRIFGRHLDMSGYGVGLDGKGYAYRSADVEQEENRSRETDSRAAWELVVSMNAILDEAETRLEILKGYQDDWHVTETSVISKEAALAKRFYDPMKRWYTLNQKFQGIYGRYPKNNLLQPPDSEDVDMKLWQDAIVHGRRDELMQQFRGGEGMLAGEAAYKGEIGRARGFDPTTGGSELPDPPKADPELFHFGRPYPAALLGDATDLDALDSMSKSERKQTLEEMRRKHGKLGPHELRTIGDDRAAWGFRGGKADYVLKMGARIAHALATGAAPGTVWTIEGHTDSTDTSVFNAYLGYRRASAVRNLLVEAGVPPAVLTVRSHGEERAAHQDFLASINGYERGDDARALDRRVVVGDEAGETAVDALYGKGVDPTNLSTGEVLSDDDDKTARRERQRSSDAKEEFEAERRAIEDEESYASLVREYYEDHPSYLTLFTTILALAPSGGEKILANNPRFKIREFFDACRSQGLQPRLPCNWDAVNSERASEITFQPGTFERVDEYTMTLSADVWKIGGLELNWYAFAWDEMRLAILERFEQTGGPSMRLDQVAKQDGKFTRVADGYVKPDDWSLSGETLSMTFIAANDLGVELLDAMSTELLPYAAAEGGDETVGKLAVSGTEGEGDLDRVRREQRQLEMWWIVGDGTVALMTPRTYYDVPRDVDDRAWQKHVDEHLQALTVDVSMDDDGRAGHGLHLGPMVEIDTASQKGSFDVKQAYDAWLEAQGRDSVAAEADYEDRDLADLPDLLEDAKNEEQAERTEARQDRLERFRQALLRAGMVRSRVT